MIDAMHETIISLRRAAELPPLRNHRTGKPSHVASIYRHVMHGALDANGNRVKLETIRTPAGLLTSKEAVERFIRRLTAPDLPPVPTFKQQEAHRRRQIEAAEKRLAVAGI